MEAARVSKKSELERFQRGSGLRCVTVSAGQLVKLPSMPVAMHNCLWLIKQADVGTAVLPCRR